MIFIYTAGVDEIDVPGRRARATNAWTFLLFSCPPIACATDGVACRVLKYVIAPAPHKLSMSFQLTLYFPIPSAIISSAINHHGNSNCRSPLHRRIALRGRRRLPSALPSRTSPPLLSLAPATPSPSSKAALTSSAASPHPAHSPTTTCTWSSCPPRACSKQTTRASLPGPQNQTAAHRRRKRATRQR